MGGQNRTQVSGGLLSLADAFNSASEGKPKVAAATDPFLDYIHGLVSLVDEKLTANDSMHSSSPPFRYEDPRLTQSTKRADGGVKTDATAFNLTLKNFEGTTVKLKDDVSTMATTPEAQTGTASNGDRTVHVMNGRFKAKDMPKVVTVHPTKTRKQNVTELTEVYTTSKADPPIRSLKTNYSSNIPVVIMQNKVSTNSMSTDGNVVSTTVSVSPERNRGSVSTRYRNTGTETTTAGKSDFFALLGLDRGKVDIPQSKVNTSNINSQRSLLRSIHKQHKITHKGPGLLTSSVPTTQTDRQQHVFTYSPISESSKDGFVSDTVIQIVPIQKPSLSLQNGNNNFANTAFQRKAGGNSNGFFVPELSEFVGKGSSVVKSPSAKATPTNTERTPDSTPMFISTSADPFLRLQVGKRENTAVIYNVNNKNNNKEKTKVESPQAEIRFENFTITAIPPTKKTVIENSNDSAKTVVIKTSGKKKPTLPFWLNLLNTHDRGIIRGRDGFVSYIGKMTTNNRTLLKSNDLLQRASRLPPGLTLLSAKRTKRINNQKKVISKKVDNKTENREFNYTLPETFMTGTSFNVVHTPRNRSKSVHVKHNMHEKSNIQANKGEKSSLDRNGKTASPRVSTTLSTVPPQVSRNIRWNLFVGSKDSVTRKHIIRDNSKSRNQRQNLFPPKHSQIPVTKDEKNRTLLFPPKVVSHNNSHENSGTDRNVLFPPVYQNDKNIHNKPHHRGQTEKPPQHTNHHRKSFFPNIIYLHPQSRLIHPEGNARNIPKHSGDHGLSEKLPAPKNSQGHDMHANSVHRMHGATQKKPTQNLRSHVSHMVNKSAENLVNHQATTPKPRGQHAGHLQTDHSRHLGNIRLHDWHPQSRNRSLTLKPLTATYPNMAGISHPSHNTVGLTVVPTTESHFEIAEHPTVPTTMDIFEHSLVTDPNLEEIMTTPQTTTTLSPSTTSTTTERTTTATTTTTVTSSPLSSTTTRTTTQVLTTEQLSDIRAGRLLILRNNTMVKALKERYYKELVKRLLIRRLIQKNTQGSLKNGTAAATQPSPNFPERESVEFARRTTTMSKPSFLNQSTPEISQPQTTLKAANMEPGNTSTLRVVNHTVESIHELDTTEMLPAERSTTVLPTSTTSESEHLLSSIRFATQTTMLENAETTVGTPGPASASPVEHPTPGMVKNISKEATSNGTATVTLTKEGLQRLIKTLKLIRALKKAKLAKTSKNKHMWTVNLAALRKAYEHLKILKNSSSTKTNSPVASPSTFVPTTSTVIVNSTPGAKEPLRVPEKRVTMSALGIKDSTPSLSLFEQQGQVSKRQMLVRKSGLVSSPSIRRSNPMFRTRNNPFGTANSRQTPRPAVYTPSVREAVDNGPFRQRLNHTAKTSLHNDGSDLQITPSVDIKTRPIVRILSQNDKQISSRKSNDFRPGVAQETWNRHVSRAFGGNFHGRSNSFVESRSNNRPLPTSSKVQIQKPIPPSGKNPRRIVSQTHFGHVGRSSVFNKHQEAILKHRDTASSTTMSTTSTRRVHRSTPSSTKGVELQVERNLFETPSSVRRQRILTNSNQDVQANSQGKPTRFPHQSRGNNINSNTHRDNRHGIQEVNDTKTNMPKGNIAPRPIPPPATVPRRSRNQGMSMVRIKSPNKPDKLLVINYSQNKNKRHNRQHIRRILSRLFGGQFQNYNRQRKQYGPLTGNRRRNRFRDHIHSAEQQELASERFEAMEEAYENAMEASAEYNNHIFRRSTRPSLIYNRRNFGGNARDYQNSAVLT